MTSDEFRTSQRLDHIVDIEEPVADIKLGDGFWVSRNVEIKVPLYSLYKQAETDDMTAQTHEAIFIYVAVIVANRGFKVYYGNGERQAPEQVREHGAKLRNEEVARLLFPQLDAYAYV